MTNACFPKCIDGVHLFLFVHSSKTGHYTPQQNPNTQEEDRYEASLTANSSKPSSVHASVVLSSSPAPCSRSQPFSSPRHSPNTRTRHQPACRRSYSQVGPEGWDEKLFFCSFRVYLLSLPKLLQFLIMPFHWFEFLLMSWRSQCWAFSTDRFTEYRSLSTTCSCELSVRSGQ